MLYLQIKKALHHKYILVSPKAENCNLFVNIMTYRVELSKEGVNLSS
jgi:hypothetical protein